MPATALCSVKIDSLTWAIVSVDRLLPPALSYVFELLDEAVCVLAASQMLWSQSACNSLLRVNIGVAGHRHRSMARGRKHDQHQKLFVASVQSTYLFAAI